MATTDIARPRTGTTARAPAQRRWWTLAAVCTGVFMLLLDLTIVNVALPDIERAFGASLSDLQWVISAYALTLAAFLLTAGSLADLYGRRLLFAIGIVIFTTGSLFCGLATGLALPDDRAGRPGHRRRHHVRDVARAPRAGVPGPRPRDRARALRRDHGRRRSRSARCSAGRSRAACPGAGSSSSTSRSAPSPCAMTLLRVDESRNPAARRPDWAGFATFSDGPRRARVRPDPEPDRRLGLDHRDRVARRERGDPGGVRRRRAHAVRADARPRAAARADVRRRPGRGLGGVGGAAVHDHLPDHLHAEHPRPLGRRRPASASCRSPSRSSSPPASPGG